jgi:hypothetical protein
MKTYDKQAQDAHAEFVQLLVKLKAAALTYRPELDAIECVSNADVAIDQIDGIIRGLVDLPDAIDVPEKLSLADAARQMIGGGE